MLAPLTRETYIKYPFKGGPEKLQGAESRWLFAKHGVRPC